MDTPFFPADLKKLPLADLPRLAAELRAQIISVVLQNGGHLASSLGAVDLIVALHYVLDAPRDKIVFDVGHQCYAHKILTGRGPLFPTLRRAGGLSGFPKRAESAYDAFDTGHASTSVSAALGLACARDLAGEDYAVAAVIGDGALTGGLAWEALNQAGALKKKLLVILNDNNMSISPNVGGLSEYLSLLTTRPEYVKLRGKIKGSLNEHLPPQGRLLVKRLMRIETAVKSVLTEPSTLFEEIGFKYVGPFDGHDIPLLVEVLSRVKDMGRPVLVHVATQKGKGYGPAEKAPAKYHGVGAAPAGASPAPKPPSYSSVFGAWLTAAAQADGRVVAVTAAMSQGTGLSGFFDKFPGRAFDVGIAEEHAVALAAGLAAGGLRPFAAIYSTFLQRAFDQLYHDVALQNLPVALGVDRAGLVGEDGPTHHGGLDLAYLRLLPNFTVMAPADGRELRAMLALALALGGPSAIRYPRGSVPAPDLEGTGAPLALGRGVRLRQGKDVSLIAIGATVSPALGAAGLLAGQGVSASVVDMRFIKPLDGELVAAEARATGHLLAVEENTALGGLYGAVAEALAASLPGRPYALASLALPDGEVPQASQEAQRASLGLDAAGIAAAARKLLG